jgi:anti-sigma28 factor (negative regulator of flagellin synthesis)
MQLKRYVKQQGSYWIKTNENTGWWIEIEGGYYTTITNGSTSQLVPKYLIIEHLQNQQQNYYHQNQQNQQNQNQELQELQQQELQEQEFQQQQNQPNQKTFTELERVNELERNEPQRERVKCQKCGLEGSYVKRKVKSHYYLYIRHKTNGKIKECLISRLA